MNYRKYLYRRHDITLDRLKKIDTTQSEPFKGFNLELNEILANEELISLIQKNAIPKSQTWDSDWAEIRKLEAVNKKLIAAICEKYVGPQFVNIHVLVGYCPQTIPYYQKMIKEMRRTFPEAKTKDINCHQVTKSSCVQGFTLITWNGEINFPLAKREGLSDYYHTNNGPEYYW